MKELFNRKAIVVAVMLLAIELSILVISILKKSILMALSIVCVAIIITAVLTVMDKKTDIRNPKRLLCISLGLISMQLLCVAGDTEKATFSVVLISLSVILLVCAIRFMKKI